MEKFARRHGLRSFKCHGESASADNEALQSALPDIIAKIASYPPSNVYNMDETGLFYRLAPSRSVSQRQLAGIKKDKTRMTIALTANADGSHKLPPWFIGYYRMPRAFNKKTAVELGFQYSFNRKAWMSTVIFQDWTVRLDSEMERRDKKILLLLDNAPTHKLHDLTLSSIEVLYLPPNTTSIIQPMDAGIIAAFKRRYRRFQLRDALDKLEAGKQDIYRVDQLSAMKWCTAAWEELTKDTICNCFGHTGLFTSQDLITQSVSISIESTIDDELRACMDDLHLEDQIEISELVAPEYERVATHMTFTDEEIVELCSTVQPDEEESENDEGDGDTFSTNDKLRAIPAVLSLLDVTEEKELDIYKFLRRKQEELKSATLTQCSLDCWIGRRS